VDARACGGRWTAGLVQGLTATLRGISTATTGGFANPLFASAELGGSLVTAILALLLPVAVAAALAAAILFTLIWLWRRRAARRELTVRA